MPNSSQQLVARMIAKGLVRPPGKERALSPYTCKVCGTIFYRYWEGHYCSISCKAKGQRKTC